MHFQCQSLCDALREHDLLLGIALILRLYALAPLSHVHAQVSVRIKTNADEIVDCAALFRMRLGVEGQQPFGFIGNFLRLRCVSFRL